MTDEERARDIFRRMLQEVLNFAERITMIAQEADQKKIPDLPKETSMKLIEEFMDEVQAKVKSGEVIKETGEIFGLIASGFVLGVLKMREDDRRDVT